MLAKHDDAGGKAFVEMVREGVVSGFYEADWAGTEDAVLIAPVHTFLLRNRAFAHQLWLDAGSTAWHRRIHQPLTNPYVLSKDWDLRQAWTREHEKTFEVDRLARIVAGLIRRCTHSVYLYASELSAHGQEQDGELLLAVGDVMRMKREEG